MKFSWGLLEDIRRPLQRSSVRDILHLQSSPRSDASGFQTSSSDLLIPSIWYICRGPRRCGVDVSSMEIPWRFDGDSMEIRWRDHGETMERPWSDPRHPDHQNDSHFDTFSILSEGPRIFRILSNGPGTFRKKRKTTITPSHRVPGPSGRSWRVLGPSENSVRPPETIAKSPK